MSRRKDGGFRFVFIAPALAIIALLAWALASPIGASPDDDYHLSSIWCASATDPEACDPGESEQSRIVPAVIVGDPCYATEPATSAACQTRMLNADPAPTDQTLRVNLAGNYPPVYYAVMSVFVGSDVESSAFLMRMVNIGIFVGVTSALFALLPSDRRRALIGAWIISTVPLGLFLVSSNNPSAWSIIGIGSMWVALLGYFETAGRRKVALGVLTGATALMAVGSRADSAFYAAVAAAVVVLFAAKRSKAFYLDCILPAAIILAAAVSFLTSRQASSGVEGFGAGRPGGTPVVDKAALMLSNIRNLPDLLAGPFGTWSLGWFDTPMPTLVVFGATVSFVAIAFVGLSVLTIRKGIIVAVVAAVFVALPLYVLFRGSQLVGESVQPRYLLPLLVLLSGLLLLGGAARSVSFTRVQIALIVALLSVSQVVALHTNIRRYISGLDVGIWNLDVAVEWWWDIPVSPMFVLIIGSAAYTALLAILAAELWTGGTTKRSAPLQVPEDSSVLGKPAR